MTWWRRNWLTIFALIVMFGALPFVYARLPERVPIHWNLGGHPDDYGSRLQAVLNLAMLPGVAIFLQLLLVGLLRSDPRAQRNAATIELWQQVFVWTFLTIFTGVVSSYLGARAHVIGQLAFLGVGFMFVLFSNVMTKLTPNAMAGVRTPHTLASDQAWYKTHRVASFGGVVIGLMCIIIAVLNFNDEQLIAALVVLIGLLLIGVIALCFYAAREWRRDPKRRPLWGPHK